MLFWNILLASVNNCELKKVYHKKPFTKIPISISER